MMIIETWVAAILICGIALMGILAIFYSLVESERLEETRKELASAQKENAELKHYIAVQRTKAIIGVANDFYNEGEKK